MPAHWNPGKRIIPPHLMRRLLRGLDRRSEQSAQENFDRETQGILTGDGEVAGFALQYTPPAFTLGTTNTEGTGLGVVPADSTLHAFTDTPGPLPSAPVGAPGVRAFTSRDDHQHQVRTLWAVFISAVAPLAGQILQAVDDTHASWQDPPPHRYRQYIWSIDGSNGWGFVDVDDGTGQRVPVTMLYDTE